MIIAKQHSYLLLAAILLAFISGCSNDEPTISKPSQTTNIEVNDENCKLENIKKISDKLAREEFAGLCFR